MSALGFKLLDAPLQIIECFVLRLLALAHLGEGILEMLVLVFQAGDHVGSYFKGFEPGVEIMRHGLVSIRRLMDLMLEPVDNASSSDFPQGRSDPPFFGSFGRWSCLSLVLKDVIISSSDFIVT